jgi:hypothetical protein
MRKLFTIVGVTLGAFVVVAATSPLGGALLAGIVATALA